MDEPDTWTFRLTGRTHTGPIRTGPPTHTGPTYTGPTHTGPTHTGPTHTGPTGTGLLDDWPAHRGGGCPPPHAAPILGTRNVRAGCTH